MDVDDLIYRLTALRKSFGKVPVSIGQGDNMGGWVQTYDFHVYYDSESNEVHIEENEFIPQ